jgi:hypothetical protein
VKQFKESGSDRSVDEGSDLVGWYAVVAGKYRHFGGRYCLFFSIQQSWMCNIHEDLNLRIMENSNCIRCSWNLFY